MREWHRDFRYSLRSLLKSPLFTIIAIASLALGIGANTAIFTLLDQVLLRLLPVRNPEQLVLLSWNGFYHGNNTGTNALSYPMYRDIRDHNAIFSDVFCRYALPMSMGYGGRTERVDGELVSGSYFSALGVGAALGRTITPDDDRIPGGHPVAVLSYDFWRDRFSADPAIVGKTILVNGHRLAIIGVSQEGFHGVEVGTSPKIRVPVMMKREMTPSMMAEFYNLEERRSRWVNIFGRLKPGVTPEQAHAALQPLFHSILEREVREKGFERASTYTRQQFLKATLDVLPAARGRSLLRNRVATSLWVLMALVGLVLLIACANVANLMMARAAGRQRETALRFALGAGRARVIRQLVTESLLLSIAGGGLGVALAFWTDRLLVRLLIAGDSPVTLELVPDLRILGFTFAISLATGLLFGVFPAFAMLRVDLAHTLKEQAGSVLGGGHSRVRKPLVVAQVFLSLLLVTGAGLFIRSLLNLKSLNLGFRTGNLIAFSIDPMLNGYDKGRALLFYRELTRKLREAPGTGSAAFALVRMLNNDEWDSTISVEGYDAKPGENMNPYYNAVSPHYFDTLGIGMLAGRDFSLADEGSQHKVAIVNEKFASRFFGGVPRAIGRHFGFGGDPGTKTEIEIVGVIRDTRFMTLREPVREQVYVPYGQLDFALDATAYVRTSRDPEQMFAAVRQTVSELDPNLPVYGLRTLEAQLDLSLVTERLIALLASMFGILATTLAAIGVYGVMAYMVAQRTREIGIRVALGARNHDVMWLVIREVLLLIVAGVGLALPAALALSRLIQSQLYGIAPHDPLTVGLAILAIAITAVLAGAVPALRAARVDPAHALRYE